MKILNQSKFNRQFSRKILKNCTQLGIGEVIKKFVDWCDEIYTYKAMLTTFVGKIKQ